MISKRNGLICCNCGSGELTLVLGFGDEPIEKVSVSYRCENCHELHLICSIYSNAFQPEGLEGLHVVGGDSDA